MEISQICRSDLYDMFYLPCTNDRERKLLTSLIDEKFAEYFSSPSLLDESYISVADFKVFF